MRIALCSTFVPFIKGGARNIVEWLQIMLERDGHTVERIYLPEHDSPDTLVQQMAAFRWIDLSAADRIICFRPQSHLIPHPNKILWFIHHLRVFYDLWGSAYAPENSIQNRRFRETLIALDNQALGEARSIFTNSREVSDRLKSFNNVNSEVLFPPIFEPDRFFRRDFNDHIVCICRLEHHKRQHLLIEALRFTKSPVKLLLRGSSGATSYPLFLRQLISDYGLGDRVSLDDQWIEESEKIEVLADCLAAAYIPLNEDSYGYPSLEAAHSRKAVLTTSDAGGVLELVQDGINGKVTEPEPKALAAAMDALYFDRRSAKRMGEDNNGRLSELSISWSHAINRLLS